MMRALFYRGRHHVRTAPRRADGGIVTVRTIAAKLRREAQERARGAVWISVIPEVSGFSSKVRALLSMCENPERFAPEQLGAMSV